MTAPADVFVTLSLGGQLCGIDVGIVRDVLGELPIARVPLAPEAVAGSLNLRGRIVTAIDLRRRLGLPPRPGTARPMSVVVDRQGELYSLLVDAVGEVLALPRAGLEEQPPTLDATWRLASRGVHRLEGRLMVVLDAARLLEFGAGMPG